MGKHRSKSISVIIIILYAFRICLVFLPQNSYLYPEEFDPHLESYKGNIFGYHHKSPLWPQRETNPEAESLPTRNIVISHLFYGWSLYLLKFANGLVEQFWNISILTPYTLLVTPRAGLCLLSFLIDRSLYRIASLNHDVTNSRLLMLASMSLIFTACTHSSLSAHETILFALLLQRVAAHITHAGVTQHRCKESPSKRAMRRRTSVAAAAINDDRMTDGLAVGAICGLGVFNRPTFLIYMLAPLCFWLARGTRYKHLDYRTLTWRICALVCGALPMAIGLIIADSWYYHQRYIVTPWIYAEQNFHLGFTCEGISGTLVNLFGQFHVLAVYALFGFGETVIRIVRKAYGLHSWQSMRALMMASYTIPTVLLTCVQRPFHTDLLPLLMPLCYVFADDINNANALQIPYEHKDKYRARMKDTRAPLQKIKMASALWIITNCLMLYICGCAYEAGVLDTSMKLAREAVKNTDLHVFTSHTYPIPYTLFMQNQHEPTNVYVHDMNTTDYDVVLDEATRIGYEEYMQWRHYKIYLMVPSWKVADLQAHATKRGRSHLNEVYSSFPHVNFDITGNVFHVFGRALHSVWEYSERIAKSQFRRVNGVFSDLHNAYHLKLYEII